MPVRVARMAPAARTRFLEAIAYVAARNPVAAENMVREMRALRVRLAEFPQLGVRGDIPGTRRVVMAPYILTIRMASDGIEIVAFRHAKQKDAYAPRELLDEQAGEHPPTSEDDV